MSARYALACAVVAHIALAGCYQPSLRDCTVTCAAADECAGDQVCLSDGFCAGPDVARCTDKGEPIIVDAAVATNDAPTSPADAFSLCDQGCTNGTCIDGVCTIDCSATGSCLTDVVCPTNLPCHVICGDSSCTHHVNCTMSTACQVDCAGDGACQDEIQCPAGDPCEVTCSGSSSCKRRTKCGNSCSCDVTCSGSGSCAEASECPMSSECRIGNGCTSQLSGCDACP